MLSPLLLLSAWAPAPAEIARSGAIPLARANERIVRLRREGFDLPAARSGVELHRVRYASTGLDGEARILSGLLAVPAGGPIKGFVVEFHGTIADRAFSPSRYAGGVVDPKSKDPQPTHPEAEAVALAFATGGYAVAMPDYLGLGDDPGVHPYPLAEVNARSGIDMVSALRGTRSDLAGPLFVTGYSEGGAVAMWAVRKLEAAGVPVAAASPMSGPYDLSGVTARSLLRGGQGLTGLGEKLFLLGYTAYSAQARHPELDLRAYFAPSMATYIPFVFKQNLPQGTVGRKLVVKALQMGANGSVIQVLTDRFRLALQNGDTSELLVADLKANDTYDWTPQTKMLLPFLGNDGVVVPENTTRTLAAMRRHGVGEDLVRGFQIAPRKGLNHSSAAGPALAASRRFFDGGFAGVGPEVIPALVKGTVNSRERSALPADAVLAVRLVEVTELASPIIVAETRREMKGVQLPVPFQLAYERARILPHGRYELRAEIATGGATGRAGSRRFIAPEPKPIEIDVKPTTTTPTRA